MAVTSLTTNVRAYEVVMAKGATADMLPCCSVASAFIALVVVSHLFVSSSFFKTAGIRLRQANGPPFGEEGILRVYVADLPREFNYGLLESYWAERKQGRTMPGDEDDDNVASWGIGGGSRYPPYPQNPLWKQYSAEYWLLGDLMRSPNETGSIAKRVVDPVQADVVFVPFFAALSAELQLGRARGKFRHRKDNEDYDRQQGMLDIVKNTSQWKHSGGRDHVFVLTDPMAMWHLREELANSMLLVVDFGGWYMEDAKHMQPSSAAEAIVQHTQVSLIKDVIVPYTHLLPTLPLSENRPRSTLLYFKGARYRHRTGLVRDKLWSILEGEPGVVLEEGFPNKTGQVQAIKGMRSSEFCLHPAGDTPSSCRLFDAVASLCIPVIVSDSIELPFEGMLDYLKFSVFVSVQDALQPRWLVQHLQRISVQDRNSMRHNLAKVQHHFEYDQGGRGPVKDGAVDMIWRKVLSKVPGVKEAIARSRRKPSGALLSSRCHCL